MSSQKEAQLVPAATRCELLTESQKGKAGSEEL